MAGDGQVRDLKLPGFTAQLGWPWSPGTHTDSSPFLSQDISLYASSAPGVWLLRQATEVMLCHADVCYTSARASLGSDGHPGSSIRGPGCKLCPDATHPSLYDLRPCPGLQPPPLKRL